MFAIVDIETTGGSPQQSRITEIAVYLSDGKKVVDQFITLVNPEQHIPSFITKLTGISDEMVASAPRFQDISSQLALITKDAVFVAHNVAFDYGMIRHEYRELGMEFHRQLLCTVKSSRKLIPGYPSYSLGNLCKELNIEIEHRHRAGGDALATMELFHLLYGQHKPDLLSLIEEGSPRFTGDPKADRMLENIPERTGVYFLHDSNQDVIYVGGGTNIRKKVLHHLTKGNSRQAFELRNSIADVSFEITGSELLALLMEMSEIRRLKPMFNRRYRPLAHRKIMLSKPLHYLIDKGPDRSTKIVVRVAEDQVGWGYFPSQQSISSTEDLDMFIRYVAIGTEYRSLIDAFLAKGRVEKII
ncbi:MAG: ribonuclease H-like domain-containing protein [Flavobacteriales bacterium]|nr:ribonuclease H-like domain-containing protein [Flavobacteriales bacterium]